MKEKIKEEKLDFYIEERTGIQVLQWTSPSVGCRPAHAPEIKMWNRIKALEAQLADSKNATVNELRKAKNYEDQILHLRALVRTENMPELFDVNDDATTELAIEVAELRAQLAHHQWHRIDPDDPGTWPEDGKRYTLKSKYGNYSCLKWNSKAEDYIASDFIYYQEVVGPEDGE